MSIFKREFAVGESKLKKKDATTYELDSKDVPGKAVIEKRNKVGWYRVETLLDRERFFIVEGYKMRGYTSKNRSYQFLVF